MTRFTFLLVFILINVWMPSTHAYFQPPSDETIAYVREHETNDFFLSKAADNVRRVLGNLYDHSRMDVDLFITDFAEDPPFLPSLFVSVSNCIAVYEGLERPSVICNAQFLEEIEIAIRRFEDWSDFAQSEANLFQFTRLASANSRQLLASFRTANQSSEHIILHLTLALLFLASHELGHLVEEDGYDYSAFTESVRPGHDEVRSAVVKMCRHADEFSRYGFGLSGLEWLIEATSEPRKVEAHLRQEIALEQKVHQQRFHKEEQADKFATEAILRYLSNLERANPEAALEHEHLIFETLFAIAMYTWYKKFGDFIQKECGWLGVRTSRLLTNSYL